MKKFKKSNLKWFLVVNIKQIFHLCYENKKLLQKATGCDNLFTGCFCKEPKDKWKGEKTNERKD